MLEQHVIADGIHERPEAVCLTKSFAAAQDRKNPSKDFLAHVFDRFPGIESGTQFELDQLAEVGNEVFFGAEVARTKPFQVAAVKSIELHAGASGPTKVCSILHPPNEGVGLFCKNFINRKSPEILEKDHIGVTKSECPALSQ